MQTNIDKYFFISAKIQLNKNFKLSEDSSYTVEPSRQFEVYFKFIAQGYLSEQETHNLLCTAVHNRGIIFDIKKDLKDITIYGFTEWTKEQYENY